MESRTYIKNVKVSPRKLRFLLPSIKKMQPSTALDFLNYTTKKGAKVYYQAIKSAISNAKLALKVNDDMLEFRLLTIEEGQKLKRFNPGGRGTAKPYVKRFSNIKMILGINSKIDQQSKVVSVKDPVKKVSVRKSKVTVKSK